MNGYQQLDFDYTVCDYTSELEELIYDQAKEYLVENCGYPNEIRASRYDPSFAIRVWYSYDTA